MDFDARLDFIGLVDGDGDTVALTATQNRDGQTGPVGRFRIEAVPVHGRNKPILHPLVEYHDEDPDHAERSARANPGPTSRGKPPARTVDDRVLKQLVVHGAPTSIGGLALSLSCKSFSSIHRAVGRLRRSHLLDGYQLTPAGIPQVDRALGVE